MCRFAWQFQLPVGWVTTGELVTGAACHHTRLYGVYVGRGVSSLRGVGVMGDRGKTQTSGCSSREQRINLNGSTENGVRDERAGSHHVNSPAERRNQQRRQLGQHLQELSTAVQEIPLPLLFRRPCLSPFWE